MAYRIVGVIGGPEEKLPLGACPCKNCKFVNHTGRNAIIVDSDPTRRYVRYQHWEGHERGDTKDGVHALILPYVRTVIGFTSRENANDGYDFRWTRRIHLFGSLEPFESLQQPVFPLPMPNMSRHGELYCVGEMDSRFGCFKTEKELVESCIKSFWDSTFTYWNHDWETGQNFRVLQGGLKTLREIPIPENCTLERFYPKRCGDSHEGG